MKTEVPIETNRFRIENIDSHAHRLTCRRSKGEHFADRGGARALSPGKLDFGEWGRFAT